MIHTDGASVSHWPSVCVRMPSAFVSICPILKAGSYDVPNRLAGCVWGGRLSHVTLPIPAVEKKLGKNLEKYFKKYSKKMGLYEWQTVDMCLHDTGEVFTCSSAGHMSV